MTSRGWKARFFTIWGGQAFSLVGSALVRFALIWWLTDTTHSATTLATASLASFLPAIAVGPFAGALIDRWPRRWIMVIADALIALFTALLGLLFWLGVAQIWHVYLVLLLRAAGDSFQTPAMLASTTLMVPEGQLSRVAGMNQVLEGMVSIASPALGALLLAVAPLQGILAIDILTAMLAIAPLLFLDVPQPELARDEGNRGGVRRMAGDLAEGLRYLSRWRAMFLLLLLITIWRILVVPLYNLIPLLVTEHFRGGAVELAWVSSARGLSVILGGSILTLWGGFKRRTLTILVGLFLVSLFTALLGLVPAGAFWAAVATMVVRTLWIPLALGSWRALLQSSVPPELQGRVFALVASLVTLALPVGLALAGPLADRIGVRWLFPIWGGMAAGISLLGLLTPRIVRLEDHPPPMIEALPTAAVSAVGRGDAG